MARPPRSKARYPDIEKEFEVQETLGTGGFAKVKAGVHRATGEKVAIKIMDKVLLGHDLPRAKREIRVLKKLHHQHIGQLYQVVETDRMFYMIMEVGVCVCLFTFLFVVVVLCMCECQQ
jgi:maternal embryonic leucine zipper kinase